MGLRRADSSPDDQDSTRQAHRAQHLKCPTPQILRARILSSAPSCPSSTPIYVHVCIRSLHHILFPFAGTHNPHYSLLPNPTPLSSPTGVSPTTLTFRHKVQTYALNITNSKHLTIANLTFFGTTLHAAGGIPFLRLESLQMLHPSCPRRMLGITHSASPTVLSEVDSYLLSQANGYSPVQHVDQSRLTDQTKMRGNFRGHNPTAKGSSFTVYNCTW